MATIKPRTNKFNGSERPASKLSTERDSIEQFLLDHPGQHTVQQIADATGLSVETVRRRAGAAAFEGAVVNRNAGHTPAKYQHRDHWKREQMVSRREPITNAGMPNGSTAWWAKHMAAFNTPPRAA